MTGWLHQKHEANFHSFDEIVWNSKLYVKCIWCSMLNRATGAHLKKLNIQEYWWIWKAAPRTVNHKQKNWKVKHAIVIRNYGLHFNFLFMLFEATIVLMLSILQSVSWKFHWNFALKQLFLIYEYVEKWIQLIRL